VGVGDKMFSLELFNYSNNFALAAFQPFNCSQRLTIFGWKLRYFIEGRWNLKACNLQFSGMFNAIPARRETKRRLLMVECN
jgi:hypothetical protein